MVSLKSQAEIELNLEKPKYGAHTRVCGGGGEVHANGKLVCASKIQLVCLYIQLVLQSHPCHCHISLQDITRDYNQLGAFVLSPQLLQ